MTKKKHNSGWYRSEGGQTFHAHGKGMSDETIAALGKLADAAAAMMDSRCPQCGGTWDKVLHYVYVEKRWQCDCGWTGDTPDKAPDDNSTWRFEDPVDTPLKNITWDIKFDPEEDSNRE